MNHHFNAIAQLPCLITRNTLVEVCHVRFGDPEFSKPLCGMGQKPEDKWVVPLSAEMHRLSDRSQHSMREQEFWKIYNLPVLLICTDLWAASPNAEKMMKVITQRVYLRQF